MKIFENRNIESLDNEIWKNIEEYNGNYQISNYGRIKSFIKWRGTDVRILKQYKDNHGYLFIRLYENNEVKNKYIHILMFETFNNCKLKENECIHHIDENPLNNNLNNFQLMDKSEHLSLHKTGENNSIFDKKCPKHSRRMSGENNPSSILTEQDIIQIWKYLSEGILNQKEIAEIFGVSRQTISHIKNKRIWKYYEDN